MAEFPFLLDVAFIFVAFWLVAAPQCFRSFAGSSPNVSIVFLVAMFAALGSCHHFLRDSLAEWSKALAQGASPQGRGFEPHSCHCPSCKSLLSLCLKRVWFFLSGTWCSGITPAQHAGGPGFNPQRVHACAARAVFARVAKLDRRSHGDSNPGLPHVKRMSNLQTMRRFPASRRRRGFELQA